MKKIIFLLAIAAFVMSCNSPKEPPDDYLMQRINAHADSIKKVEALQKQNIVKQ